VAAITRVIRIGAKVSAAWRRCYLLRVTDMETDSFLGRDATDNLHYNFDRFLCFWCCECGYLMPWDPSLAKPFTYKDSRTSITLYVESDGRHVAAIDAEGKLWLDG
jgi:hypothetical protein